MPSSLMKLERRPSLASLLFGLARIPWVIAFRPVSLTLLCPISRNSRVEFTFRVSAKF